MNMDVDGLYGGIIPPFSSDAHNSGLFTSNPGVQILYIKTVTDIERWWYDSARFSILNAWTIISTRISSFGMPGRLFEHVPYLNAFNSGRTPIVFNFRTPSVQILNAQCSVYERAPVPYSQRYNSRRSGMRTLNVQKLDTS